MIIHQRKQNSELDTYIEGGQPMESGQHVDSGQKTQAIKLTNFSVNIWNPSKLE